MKMPYGFREKDKIVIPCEISITGRMGKRKKITIWIPKQLWIMLVNKAVNSRDHEPHKVGRGGY